MNTLGIYIYNADQDAWFADEETQERAKAIGRPVIWSNFANAREWSEGEEEAVEAVRLHVSGPDTTFVMAALH